MVCVMTGVIGVVQMPALVPYAMALAKYLCEKVPSPLLEVVFGEFGFEPGAFRQKIPKMSVTL
jgi:hypothetical protein